MGDATVLVVDDTQTVRRAITLMLAGGGFSCVEASDGLEALGVLETASVDLVLTDYYMPGLDGLGLLKRLRSDPRTILLPVLVLTIESDPDIAAELSTAGATAVVVKPIDQDRLCETVRRCLPQTW